MDSKNECYYKINNLIKYGDIFLRNNDLKKLNRMPVTREEICVGSNMHRGFYNPSPVFDIIVGNVKRGRILKKKKNTYSQYYRYSFGTDGLLQRAESIYNGIVATTEYIVRDDSTITGVTIDDVGLCVVCEEEYCDGKLCSCSFMNCYGIDNTYICFDFKREIYVYDNCGLCECIEQWLNPNNGYYVNDKYSLVRTNNNIIGAFLKH